MKNIIVSLCFVLCLVFFAASSQAETITMVTILPKPAAAFVNLDVKKDSQFYQMELGKNTEMEVETKEINVENVFVGNSMQVATLDTTSEASFKTANVGGTLVVDGADGIAAKEIKFNAVTINNVALEKPAVKAAASDGKAYNDTSVSKAAATLAYQTIPAAPLNQASGTYRALVAQ
ncbi:hypothetical protein Emin_0815 [Elusimicrobium minutum Pei191]|uniref:Uncharacterized protein n=1 Tax=Elusimicrobium minutum (strain Pei191) TaxID=445932 RepID=B2KCX4_ELUMP|nr:hypothetical protein [Elusimicrobium minutum]ACC98370.1 hypothetical protein Emin_0815 [Elusimicrobium minutum Pei191]